VTFGDLDQGEKRTSCLSIADRIRITAGSHFRSLRCRRKIIAVTAFLPQHPESFFLKCQS
jgi:hypothetical protein